MIPPLQLKRSQRLFIAQDDVGPTIQVRVPTRCRIPAIQKALAGSAGEWFLRPTIRWYPLIWKVKIVVQVIDSVTPVRHPHNSSGAGIALTYVHHLLLLSRHGSP
jgi:hypothetical protein